MQCDALQLPRKALPLLSTIPVDVTRERSVLGTSAFIV